jgi:transcription elongation factor GreB
MSKAFMPEDGAVDDGDEGLEPVIDITVKNYMTQRGFAMLQAELKTLTHEERPRVVEVVTWAAGNGDRSENGDYLYAKKRLREIDRRVRYLIKRLESAEVVEPKKQQALTRVFFGAYVTYVDADEKLHEVQLVGPDEADVALGKINWLSPLAQAMFKKEAGDKCRVVTPEGAVMIEIEKVEYRLT